MKVTPYLKGLSIYFKIYIQRKPLWISTGISLIDVSCWDQQGQRITARQYNHALKNKELKAKRLKIEETIFKTSQDNEITFESMWQALGSKPKVLKQILPPLEYIDYYTSKKKKTHSKGYLRQFKQFKNHLTQFNPNLTWQDIDFEFYDNYLNYLIEEDLQNNTISGHIKKIVTIVGDAQANGYTINLAYRDFQDVYTEPRPVFLYWHEVELLEKYQPTPEQKRYLHDYLLRCYNGLRWSDNNNNPYHNKEERTIDLTTIKTSKKQSLAISKKAEAILQQYPNGQMPKLHQHKCNFFIKEIAEAAGLNRVIQKIGFKGNERIITMLPLHKAITTHTARRSFARRWLDLGGNAIMLMKFLSHSTIQQTLKYAGYEDKEMNEEMLRIFNG